jgi:endo-1,4-beta-xylanase
MAYVKILSDITEFGQITVGNTQKWEYIEPSQNSFSYTEGDAVVSLARNNGQLVRSHNLCWYSQLPSWGMLFYLIFSVGKSYEQS